MPKQNKGTALRLNGGDLVIEIDDHGNVVAEGHRQLTAKQLDGLARLSEVTAEVGKLERSTPDMTAGGWDIINDEDGNQDGTISFGCQKVSAADIRRVHRASQAARGIKSK